MKIDFYISSLSGGGAEKVLITIAKAFAEKGDDISIISLEKRPQFYHIPDNIKLYKHDNTQKGKLASLYDFINIRRHLRKSGADVSISFLSRCNLIVLVASLFSKRRIVVCDRNNPMKEHSKKYFYLSNIIYMRANRLVVQTNQIKSYYLKKIQARTTVIENPIDTANLQAQIEKIPEREKTIISVGRLEPQKDFKTLIRAFSRISAQYKDWRVKIFGCGDMYDELQKYINNLNLQEQVLLCGRTTRPYYEMMRGSIFVLSSYYEGFPNVLCEAMYAGDLCISSDCVSGPRELIDNGENGWLFQIEDDKKLAELLESCILNEQNMTEIRDNAQKTVKRLFLNNNIEVWYKMINTVLKNKSGE